jgi:myo-inositol-1(or 4)-monophosphatase
MSGLMDMELIKRLGITATYRGGQSLREHLGRLTKITKKGAIDLVTEADTASEKAIIETISATFPDHGILAEESGLKECLGSEQWIIDPLDGTTNFAHGVELFAVSVAFSSNKKILFGAVLNPATGELFTATAGEGARLNGRPIKVSRTKTVSDALLVTGFPYDFPTIFKPMMDRFSNCLTAARGIRRLGSAALDLCFIACGRFDGYWEQNLKPWDTAAGLLIAREAGASVTDFSNSPFSIDKKEVLATNGNIHNDMCMLLKT